MPDNRRWRWHKCLYRQQQQQLRQRLDTFFPSLQWHLPSVYWMAEKRCHRYFATFFSFFSPLAPSVWLCCTEGVTWWATIHLKSVYNDDGMYLGHFGHIFVSSAILSSSENIFSMWYYCWDDSIDSHRQNSDDIESWMATQWTQFFVVLFLAQQHEWFYLYRCSL